MKVTILGPELMILCLENFPTIGFDKLGKQDHAIYLAFKK